MQQQQVNRVNVLHKIFRSKSLSLPKLRLGKRADKRVQSLQYTSLDSAQFKWKLVNSTDPQRNQDDHPEVNISYPTDVTFIAPYIFVVADSEGHKLDIFDISRAEGHQHCGSIAEDVVWPNSVAKVTNSEEKVLVTDRREKMVKMYDVETGTLLAGFGSPFNDEDIAYWPHGVAMTSKKEIVVTETSKHQVHVYTKKGKLMHSFGERGNLMENFCVPFYCSVDAADRILVADNMNYSVKMFTTKGRQVAYMGEGRQENQEKKLGSPYGVCADFSGHVLVCDNEKDRIVQYDLAKAEYEKDINMNKSAGLLSASRRSAEVATPEYKSEVIGKHNGCTSPCGIAVGPCGTMVYTEYTRRMSAIKAYTMYTVDIHTFV